MIEAPYNVRLSLGARHDLDSIYSYLIQVGSLVDPDELIQKLLDKAAQLSTFPLRGNVPKELEALGIRDFRQITMPPYRLIYQVTGDIVQILLIVDGRRDIRTLLEARVLG